MTEKAFLSPAKLNLFLLITGKRDNGYHNLQTLFQFIDWCDTLYFSEYQKPGTTRLNSDITGVPTEDNLIYKAAESLRVATYCRKGALIRIKKQLPMGGGLGGGSSNAATTLVALNQLWQTGLSLDQLAELGNQLGADVPVFVKGKAAIAEGTGDILTPVTIDQPWYLVIQPPCHVETAALFKDKYLTRNSKPIRLAAVLESPLNEIGHNDFEPVARRLFPVIDLAFRILNKVGKAQLTGTGACVFSAFPTHAAAQEALKQIQSNLQEHNISAQLTAGLNTSPLFGGSHTT